MSGRSASLSPTRDIHMVFAKTDGEQGIMEVDLISDMDTNLMSDIISEDIVLEVNPDDFVDESHQDIFKQISEDLGIPLLPEDVLNKDVLSCPKELDDFCDISEFLNRGIKSEPPSPSLSTDSQGSIHENWTTLVNTANNAKTEIVSPETPPTTPPNHAMETTPPVSPSVHFPNDEITFVASADSSECNNTSVSTSVISSPIILTNSCNAIQIKTIPVPNSSALSHKPQGTKPSSVMLNQKDVPVVTLTPQGLLQFSPPTTTTTPTTPPKASLSMNGMIQYTRQITPEVDIKAIKRQQRMIKNRESACLSRKKKKEYLQNLEAEVKEISQENALLKIENERLRLTVCELEKEIEKYCPRQNHSPTVKKATAVVAVIFLITLNLGPLSGIFLTNQQRVEKIRTSITPHLGRSLLWTVEEEEMLQTLKQVNGSYNSSEAEIQPENLTDQKLVCPMFINKTESLRLESELRGWVFGSDKEKQFTKYPKRDLKKNLPPIPRLRSYFEQEARRNRNDYGVMKDTKEIQIYQTIPQSYDDLLEAIKQRADTFYVFSFTSDHLLLPASAHNKTRRPRMSLVLPVVPLNDTMQPPKGHIAMMQIDCEVMNTKLVNIKETMIPNSSRKQHASNSFSSTMASHSNFTESSARKKKKS